MATSREILIAWLQDAYGMEKAAVQILERQASRLEGQPIVRGKVHEHARQSRQHAERVEELLARFEETPSTTKAGVGKVVANAAALANATVQDELVKTALADFAFEQFEIAAYTALIAAAGELGEPEVRRVCEGILEEERAMAAWLAEHLPEVTRAFLKNHTE